MAEAKLNFESLKNDVGAIQFCISEIIPTLGEIHASSWRFPEISSSEVNTKKLLDKIAFTENEAKFATARTLLLELAIDRLVFLLQCAFKLLESCTDEGNSAVIPLTLGSAVRKFTKKALRVNHTITAHRQQLNKKSELIVKLQNNVRVLEKDNTSLRETLAIAASKPEAEEVKEIKEVFVEKPQLEYIPVIDCKPDVESVAVQTTETAFALCASCINMQKCLLSCSTLTSQLCTSLSITSIVAEKDFQSHLNETGRIDQNLWLTLSQQDVKSVLKGISKLQEQCTKLKSELSSKDRNVKSLDFKLNEVKQEFNQCKRNSEAAQIQYKDDMANLSTEYETKFDHLREQNTKLLQDIDSIEALANEYRIRETHFKKEIDNARKCQKEFEEKLSAATSEISDQKKRCQGLQEGIRALTDELQLMKSEIEEKVVTLKKAETQNKTLSKRDKAMQGKHLTLLSKLEQLGQECNTLRTDLGGTLHDREAMAHVLSELELKCGQLQQQLIMEEQRASESFMTQKSLQLTVEALGNQLEDVKVELEQEKEKCLLLMDYPSLNGADPNYLEYIASLDYFQSQNHLSANMIRIMLLEDQNKDLRKIAEEDATKGQGNFKGGENVSIQSLYSTQCTQYKGVCADYLSYLNNKTTMHTLTLDGRSEGEISSFIDLIMQYASSQCRDAVLPFLCQYVFPPCDIISGNVNFISKTECTNIRDVVCSFEWNVVIKTPSGSLLPNCENFDENDDNSTLPIVTQPLECHYQFKEFCGLCLPLCGRFSQYRAQTKLQERSILIFSGIAAFIGGILVLIASIYRRNSMFDFPSVLVVYNTACTFVLACFVLITYIGGQERLYCSHEALNVAFDSPTVFCQMSGVVFQWSLVFLTALWLFHLIHLFIKIALPIWSRKLDRKEIKITLHIAEVTGAFISCGLAPIINVSVSDYTFGRFPPLFCLPARAVTFYTICLPLCVMLASGIILAIIMFWMLHKRQQLFERKNSKYLRYFISFSVPEVKILILSCYFMIFGIVALVNLSISIRDADIILDKLLDYFTCQARGNSTNNSCDVEYEELDSYLKPELNGITYFLLGLVPWSNLLFAIQVSDIKKAMRKVARIYSSQEKTYSTSNTK